MNLAIPNYGWEVVNHSMLLQVRAESIQNKIIAQSGARREHFWGISCEKSRILCKKIIFFPILGRARAGCAPPVGTAPDNVHCYKKYEKYLPIV